MSTSQKPSWRTVARSEGRVCPECGRPVAKKYWKNTKDQGFCYQCWYGKRGVSGVGAGGSSRYDNRGIEDEINSIYS